MVCLHTVSFLCLIHSQVHANTSSGCGKSQSMGAHTGQACWDRVHTLLWFLSWFLCCGRPCTSVCSCGSSRSEGRGSGSVAHRDGQAPQARRVVLAHSPGTADLIWQHTESWKSPAVRLPVKPVCVPGLLTEIEEFDTKSCSLNAI